MIEGISPNGIYYRTNDFVVGREYLVFIHGLSGSSSAWLEFERRFLQYYNILSFDLRGHGRSVKYSKYSDYATENSTNDLDYLLENLKIDNFHLISHSYGALIALDYLSSFQNRVKSVIFLSPGIFFTKRFVVGLLKPILSISKIFGCLPLLKKTGAHIDYSKYRNTGDWNIRRMIADISNTSLRVYLFCSRQSYDFKKTDFLNQIIVPVLVVHGKKDTVFPANNSIQIVKQIKNCNLVLLPEADHILVLNYFTEVSVAIENFLQKIKL